MTHTMQSENNIRSSNIELLKILAILLIIISHFTQTLNINDLSAEYSYAINLEASTTNAKHLVLAFFKYFGMLGNNIFFICSAWFLVDSKGSSKKKVLNMLLDVWLVSALILFAVSFDSNVELHGSTIMKNLLPTTFCNNWYITAYIIFYLIHPALNKVLESLSRKTHLSVVIIALFVYSVWYPLFREWGANLYLNQIVMWVIIYFAIAYMKRYLSHFSENTKVNVCIFAAALLGLIGSILLVNYLGLRYSFFADRLFYFITPQNLLLILISLSLFNLFKQLRLQSTFINAISKLSLLVYIMHENMLIRNNYRPLVFVKIYETFGFSHIILWVLVLAVATFVSSATVAFLYSHSLQKLTKRISDKLYPVLENKFNKLLNSIMAE